jgi:kynurenine formamidase
MSDFTPRMTDEEVLGLFQKLSNWGRWGEQDEMGTLNFIDEAKRKQAASLVSLGRNISLAHDIATTAAPNNPHPATHFVEWPVSNPDGISDYLGLDCHGMATTHIDALCHVIRDGKYYNGYDAQASITRFGSKYCSVHVMKNGIVTRAVVLDIPRAQGRDYLDVAERVHAEDLEAAEAKAGVRVGRGDAVLLRVGQYARVAVEGPETPRTRGYRRNGIDVDCLPWFRDREIALYGGDCFDCIPSGYPSVNLPIHQIAVSHMGLPLLDNVALEELSAVCAEIGRWELMLTIAPLRLRGGTGTAVNPIALL